MLTVRLHLSGQYEGWTLHGRIRLWIAEQLF